MIRPRVLFVDDEPKVLDGLRRALRDQTAVWEMAFLPDPKQAVAAYRTKAFDVVVSDLAMPGMTGLEMILALRSLGGNSAYILLTGTGDFNTAVSAINSAGIYRFFTKPCPTDLLVAGIAAALAELEPPKDEASDSGRFGLPILNRLALGIIVVSQEARVLFTNTAGARLLAERDGLAVDRADICRASVAAETAVLHDLVRRACSDAHFDDETAGMALTRPTMKRSLTVLVASTNEAKAVKRAILFVTDPDRQNLCDAETVSKLFGLSPAEGKLVHALAEGLRLDDAAARMGITVSTARTYLKQAFGKTGTGRQSELLKLVLTAAGVFR